MRWGPDVYPIQGSLIWESIGIQPIGPRPTFLVSGFVIIRTPLIIRTDGSRSGWSCTTQRDLQGGFKMVYWSFCILYRLFFLEQYTHSIVLIITLSNAPFCWKLMVNSTISCLHIPCIGPWSESELILLIDLWLWILAINPFNGSVVESELFNGWPFLRISNLGSR
jgi:hypothetical protein